MYQKIVQVIPIFAGERKLKDKAKIINAQYVKMLIIVSLDFVDIVDQLSKWNLWYYLDIIIDMLEKYR